VGRPLENAFARLPLRPASQARVAAKSRPSARLPRKRPHHLGQNVIACTPRSQDCDARCKVAATLKVRAAPKLGLQRRLSTRQLFDSAEKSLKNVNHSDAFSWVCPRVNADPLKCLESLFEISKANHLSHGLAPCAPIEAPLLGIQWPRPACAVRLYWDSPTFQASSSAAAYGFDAPSLRRDERIHDALDPPRTVALCALIETGSGSSELLHTSRTALRRAPPLRQHLLNVGLPVVRPRSCALLLIESEG
jgi:hypothetical protein